MVMIRVPKPPASAFNPDRPVSGLLRTQLEHLQEAEFRLPLRQQTNIYINAIKTEGEASEYIQRVTKAVHKAHAAVLPRRTGRVLSIAAMAARAKKKRRAGKNESLRKAKGRTRRTTGSRRKKQS